MRCLPSSPALLVLASAVGLALSFVPFSQQLHSSLPRRFDPLENLQQAEWSACVNNPGRFPACRQWRQSIRSGDLRDKVRSYIDKTYTLTLTIGNPAEKFEVAIDTGSRVLWLTAPECSDCDTDPRLKRQRKRFNYTASESFRSGFKPYNVTYAGGTVGGFLGTDSIFVGPLSVHGQDLAIAKELSPNFHNFSGDGIIGLAFPRRVQEVPRSALENLREEVQLFTVFLRRNAETETADGGAITWGSLDAVNCDPGVHFIALTHLEDKERNNHSLWTFPLDEFNFEEERQGEGEDWLAAVDTGASIIRGPYEAFNEFITIHNHGEWIEAVGAYRVKCDASFIPLTFVLGGQEYIVPPSQFVMRMPTLPDCYLALESSIGEKGQPEWLLGQPFIRTVCAIFDVAQSRIGFARHL